MTVIMAAVYPWIWRGFLVYFLVAEFFALLTGHPQYTLSAYVWRLEGLGQPWSFFRYFIAAGCIWLAGHFIFGWWR